MTDNLLTPPTETPKVDYPAKFKDAKTGALRLEALLKSYAELEKRLARAIDLPEGPDDAEGQARLRKAMGVPDRPDGYCCEMKSAQIHQDQELDQRLHAAGFTPAQAQLVYDLAAEFVLPMIEDLGERHAHSKHLELLQRHYGGEGGYREVARQVEAWGKKNLPPTVFDALSATHQGVVAMQHMMKTGEPGLMRGAVASGSESEEELDRLMRDPRYWRDRDPQLIARVTDGFKRLYRS